MANTTPDLKSPRLSIPHSLTVNLLQLYDYPHPTKQGSIIRGYDKAHALRTTKMCSAIARGLGYPTERATQYEITCLLHDLGRTGLDKRLFGSIWSWARDQKIPTRPAEWRRSFRKTPYGKETEAFLAQYREALEQHGIEMNDWACQQIEMRLGFARRMRRQLRIIRPKLQDWGISWKPWMTKVTLYYYYPEQITRQPTWVKELAEILVACEQLEAFSNRERGKDYYSRNQESFKQAFGYLDSLKKSGQLSSKVFEAVKVFTAEGKFDAILEAAKGKKLTKQEKGYLKSLAS